MPFELEKISLVGGSTGRDLDIIVPSNNDYMAILL
jgi:hypothetical protein